jgi:SAM-dependent methyltransferase
MTALPLERTDGLLSPLDIYGEDLLSAYAGRSAQTWLRDDDGGTVLLDLPRWVEPVDAADETLLDHCAAPTLDLGCGPGRLTRALVARRVDCLGVDVAPVAVALARSGGMPVLHASAFDEVLDDTRWATVLLADGNIGIGGDPVALLRRCRDLLTPSGQVLVEVEPPSAPTRTARVRIESTSGRTSRWFTWSHVSASDIDEVAAAAGLATDRAWHRAGRWFVLLQRAA